MRRRTVEIIGVPHDGLAVWRDRDDPTVTGDLEHAPAGIEVGDFCVLDVEPDGFRWSVRALVEFRPLRRSASAAARRTRAPHAHPARPPGTVVVAWLPFDRDEDSPGKHRPIVVVRSPEADIVRGLPLYDRSSAIARRHGGIALTQWRAAGLDKPSVALDAVRVPVQRCEQSLGTVTPLDAEALGITARRRR